MIFKKIQYGKGFLDNGIIKDDTCNYCLEQITDGPISLFICQHFFHSNCIKTLELCPMCRAKKYVLLEFKNIDDLKKNKSKKINELKYDNEWKITSTNNKLDKKKKEYNTLINSNEHYIMIQNNIDKLNKDKIVNDTKIQKKKIELNSLLTYKTQLETYLDNKIKNNNNIINELEKLNTELNKLTKTSLDKIKFKNIKNLEKEIISLEEYKKMLVIFENKIEELKNQEYINQNNI